MFCFCVLNISCTNAELMFCFLIFFRNNYLIVRCFTLCCSNCWPFYCNFVFLLKFFCCAFFSSLFSSFVWSFTKQMNFPLWKQKHQSTASSLSWNSQLKWWVRSFFLLYIKILLFNFVFVANVPIQTRLDTRNIIPFARKVR